MKRQNIRKGIVLAAIIGAGAVAGLRDHFPDEVYQLGGRLEEKIGLRQELPVNNNYSPEQLYYFKRAGYDINEILRKFPKLRKEYSKYVLSRNEKLFRR